MKSVTIVVPTFNEQENIPLCVKRIESIFSNINKYDYRILFVDNCSMDNTRIIIRELAKDNPKIQYIFYVRNFGFSKSCFYGLTQCNTDCAILLFADLQDPPELITHFLKYWEDGSKVVVGVKNKSNESKLMYFIRSIYYKIMARISYIDHIEQFTGFGLYDRSVLNVFRSLNDPIPYLRGIVAELAPECKKVFYRQHQRQFGKSSFKFRSLYDVAMLGMTSYSKFIMRCSLLLGVIVSFFSLLIALTTVVLKVFGIVSYPIGSTAALFGIYFLGGLILLFLGLLGEYIANINVRTMNHPIVVEQERFNLD